MHAETEYVWSLFAFEYKVAIERNSRKAYEVAVTGKQANTISTPSLPSESQGYAGRETFGRVDRVPRLFRCSKYERMKNVDDGINREGIKTVKTKGIIESYDPFSKSVADDLLVPSTA